MTERLVWIDCEMTGLDLGADALIEVAALVTDFDLNVLGDGIDIVIKPPPEALDQMVEFVQQMHETLRTARGARQRHHARGRRRPRCWPTSRSTAPTAADRRSPATPSPPTASFLARDMPELEQFLHYRIVDVSSIKELSRRWFPRAYYNAPVKGGNHRALADIRESIEELRYYREAVFVPSPGPDSVAAKRIAAHHQGSLTPDPATDKPGSEHPE